MHIAFIPAKGTSKRVLRKNLQILGGKSLVKITLDFAESLKFFDFIYLSTDSTEIVFSATGSQKHVDAFESMGEGEVLHVRNELFIHKRREGDSNESTPTVVAVLDALRARSHNTGILTILQPTSPFRSHSEFRNLIFEFQKSSAPSMVSVKEMQDIHPLKSFQINEERRIFLPEHQFHYLTTPIQNLPKYFCPDGAYYLINIDYLVTSENILSSESMVYVRSGISTLNIDTNEQMEIARSLFELATTNGEGDSE